MVIGGSNDTHGGNLDTVDLLSFNGSLPDKLKSTNNFPVAIAHAVGATLGDESVPHVCGGGKVSVLEGPEGNGGGYCWAYNPHHKMWNISGQMIEDRKFSAGATHPDHGWVITGRFFGFLQRSESAEQTRDGKTFQQFTSLPHRLSHHCIVSLGKGGGRGDFFITGGWNKDTAKRTLIYNAGAWKEVADMPTARRGKEYP